MSALKLVSLVLKNGEVEGRRSPLYPVKILIYT